MQRHAYLEITNLCNRNCRFCPGTASKKGFLSQERFRSRIRKIRDYADVIHLHVLGEPLLHPEFSSFPGLCAAESLPVELTTNGTLLTPENCDALLSGNVRQLNFSLHSLHPGEEEILESIFSFVNRAFRERPDLYLNFRLWNSLDKTGSDHWLRCAIRDAFDIPEEKMPRADSSRHSCRILKRLYLNQGPLFDWPSTLPDPENSPENSPENVLRKTAGNNGPADEGPANEGPLNESYGTCLGLLSQFAVLLDGTVTPCCLDSEGALPLGNLDDEAFPDAGGILDSPRASALREGFLRGRVVEAFCRKCTYRKRFSRGLRKRAGKDRDQFRDQSWETSF